MRPRLCAQKRFSEHRRRIAVGGFERAVAIEQALRHVRPRRLIAFAGAFGAARKRQRPPQHVDEEARERHVRPIWPRANMKEHDQPALARCSRHKRRAVFQLRPHARLRRT